MSTQSPDDLPVDVPTVPVEAEDDYVEAQVLQAQVDALAAEPEAPAPDLPVDVPTVPVEAEDDYVEAQVLQAQIDALTD